jgi:ssRNA-specific RNase YbeY (16S rRNA maturation enzyme)
VNEDGRSSGRREILIRGLARFPAVRDRRLAGWLDELVTELAPAGQSFAVRFVGDRTMRALNRDFRGSART